MKKLLFATAAFTALVAASLGAGTETYKQVAPPPGRIDKGSFEVQLRPTPTPRPRPTPPPRP